MTKNQVMQVILALPVVSGGQFRIPIRICSHQKPSELFRGYFTGKNTNRKITKTQSLFQIH